MSCQACKVFEDDKTRLTAVKPLQGNFARELGLEFIFQDYIDQQNTMVAEGETGVIPCPASIADPETFLKWLKTNEEMKGVPDQHEMLYEKFSSAYLCSFKQGAVTNNVPVGGVGYVQYQAEGSRIMATVCASEAIELFGGDLQDRDWNWNCLELGKLVQRKMWFSSKVRKVKL